MENTEEKLINIIDHLLVIVKQLHHGGENIVISMAEDAVDEFRNRGLN